MFVFLDLSTVYVFSVQIYTNPHILNQYYLNVLQQLLLAPADILQLLLLLRGEVVRHCGEMREKMKG